MKYCNKKNKRQFTAMRKKHIVAFSALFQEMFLSKDIFLVPYYIAQETGGELTYYYINNLGNTEIPQQHRGATLLHVETKNEAMAMMKTIVRNARKIDVLFINGSSAKHMTAVFLYKKINPSGKVIVFGDMEAPQAKELDMNGFMYSTGFSGKIKKLLTNFFFHNVTYIVANTEAYGYMERLFIRNGWSGLLHFYPLVDDEKFNSFGITRKTFAEKENIMVCVGRIGNYQKNTEMLLEALHKVDLKDWKIYMIGPITNSFNLNDGGDFQKRIDDFFEKCPQHKDKLIFTGMIYDQKTLFEYYNRAKILLMTSRHEGFANVYSQAAAMGCFIVSTDVGGADVCSNYWAFGEKLPQENSDALAEVIEKITSGDYDFPIEKALSFDEMCYSTNIGKIKR